MESWSTLFSRSTTEIGRTVDLYDADTTPYWSEEDGPGNEEEEEEEERKEHSLFLTPPMQQIHPMAPALPEWGFNDESVSSGYINVWVLAEDGVDFTLDREAKRYKSEAARSGKAEASDVYDGCTKVATFHVAFVELALYSTHFRDVARDMLAKREHRPVDVLLSSRAHLGALRALLVYMYSRCSAPPKLDAFADVCAFVALAWRLDAPLVLAHGLRVIIKELRHVEQVNEVLMLPLELLVQHRRELLDVCSNILAGEFERSGAQVGFSLFNAASITHFLGAATPPALSDYSEERAFADVVRWMGSHSSDDDAVVVNKIGSLLHYGAMGAFFFRSVVASCTLPAVASQPVVKRIKACKNDAQLQKVRDQYPLQFVKRFGVDVDDAMGWGEAKEEESGGDDDGDEENRDRLLVMLDFIINGGGVGNVVAKALFQGVPVTIAGTVSNSCLTLNARFDWVACGCEVADGGRPSFDWTAEAHDPETKAWEVVAEGEHRCAPDRATGQRDVACCVQMPMDVLRFCGQKSSFCMYLSLYLPD